MTIFSLICNIPQQHHAANLRDHFNSIIENSQSFLNTLGLSKFSSSQSGFVCISCFHYRHRPFSKLPFKLSNQTIDLLPSETINPEKIGIVQHLNCCIVSFYNDAAFQTFRSLYNGKPFISTDSSDDSTLLSEVCLIFRLVLNTTSSTENPLTISFLHSLPELRPPPGLPLGNVGTPIARVLESIRHCLLPTSALRSLGPDFFKRRAGGRIYSRVPPPPFLSRTSVFTSTTIRGIDFAHSVCTDEESIRTASGRDLLTASSRADKTSRREVKDPLSDGETVTADGAFDSDDDYDAEEWERHEALHDDPSQYSYR